MLPDKVSALIRASIFVRDLDRATNFYRGLGLTDTYYEGLLDDPSASSIIGFAEHRPLAIRIVKRPGPNYGMVGLFKIDDGLVPDTVPVAAGPARVGEVALVFYVRSISDALAGARAAGATWSPEPEIFRMAHREQAEVCLRDCDGVLLNLVENDPIEQERNRPELDYSA
jgi:catechol 2,3-dioxygenase-like lactoylglutathione lyase family enzyme